MESIHAVRLLAVANYPSAPIMGGATLLLLAFIIGGGYWMKAAEQKARAKERAFQQDK
jgi:hypothetical protein